MARKIKSVPKKATDITILRSMLININNHKIFSAEDYDLPLENFNAYISALIRHGIVTCTTELPIENSENLIISDIPLFETWSTSYSKLFRFVKEFVIPILQTILMTIIPAMS